MNYRFTPEPDDLIRVYLRSNPIGDPTDVLAAFYEDETEAIDRTEMLDDSRELRGTAESLYADACAILNDPEGNTYSARIAAAAVECLLRFAFDDECDSEHACAYCGGPLCINALQPWLPCTR